MKLTLLIPASGVLVTALIGAILIHVGSAQWRAYELAKTKPGIILLISEAMAVVEAVSAERDPANGVLGSADRPDPAQTEILRKARADSDADIARLEKSLAHISMSYGREAQKSLDKTRVLLEQARRDVDSVAKLPRQERTEQLIMDGAVFRMFDVVPSALETVMLLIQGGNKLCGSLPDTIAVARLVNQLREYAGRLGSHYTAALAQQKPLLANESQAILLSRGRIEQLRELIESPLHFLTTDPRLVVAVEDMEQRYFGDSLNIAARLERTSSHHQMYNVDAWQFAKLYVPGMGTLVKLRNVLISIAMEEAQAEVVSERQHMFEIVLIGSIVILVTALALILVYVRVLHPLFVISQALKSIAAEDLNIKVRMPARKDEIGEIYDTIRMILTNSIKSKQIQMTQQRTTDELETSVMNLIALNAELEQIAREAHIQIQCDGSCVCAVQGVVARRQATAC